MTYGCNHVGLDVVLDTFLGQRPREGDKTHCKKQVRYVMEIKGQDVLLAAE